MNANNHDRGGDIPNSGQTADLTPELFIPHARPWWRHLWIIGIGAYLVAVWWIGWAEIQAALRAIDIRSFGIMVVLLFVAQWLRALKWLYALGGGQGVVGAHFVSKAAGEWSPARLGEFAPLLMKNHRNTRMAAWIAVDRLLEMAATLALGLLGLVGLSLENKFALVGFGAMLLATIVAIFWLMGHERLFSSMAARFPDGSKRGRGWRLVAAISAEVRQTRGLLPFTGALTLLASFLDLAVGYFLWVCLGYPLDFLILAAAKGLHAVVSAIPLTPGATGVPYFSTAMLFHEIGGVPEGVLATGIGLSIAATAFVFWTSFGLAMLTVVGPARAGSN
jgi:hypothetical protein